MNGWWMEKRCGSKVQIWQLSLTYFLVNLDEFSNGVSLDREEKREIEPWSRQNQEAGEMRSKMIEVEKEQSLGRQETRRQDALEAKRRKYMKEERVISGGKCC